MTKMSPFRDESVRRPEDLRVRLNDMVSALNERAGQWRAVRVANVQDAMPVVLPNPGFTVGAVVMGGVNATNGALPPGTPPWVRDWTQQADGRITLTIGGLTSNGRLYAVNLVLFEGEAAK